MMKSKTVELKNIKKDYPMQEEELIDLLTDLEDKGLITCVGRNRVRLSPDAIQLLDDLRYDWDERNKDVV